MRQRVWQTKRNEVQMDKSNDSKHKLAEDSGFQYGHAEFPRFPFPASTPCYVGFTEFGRSFILRANINVCDPKHILVVLCLLN